MIYLVLVLAISSPERGNIEIRNNIDSMERCEAVVESLRLEDHVEEADCYEVDR